jgi:hypothetical protein
MALCYWKLLRCGISKMFLAHIMGKIFDYLVPDKIDETRKSTKYRARKENQKNIVNINLLKSANFTPAGKFY